MIFRELVWEEMKNGIQKHLLCWDHWSYGIFKWSPRGIRFNEAWFKTWTYVLSLFYLYNSYIHDRINELSQTLIMDLRDSNTKKITILEFSQFLAGICTISFKPINFRWYCKLKSSRQISEKPDKYSIISSTNQANELSFLLTVTRLLSSLIINEEILVKRRIQYMQEHSIIMRVVYK